MDYAWQRIIVSYVASYFLLLLLLTRLERCSEKAFPIKNAKSLDYEKWRSFKINTSIFIKFWEWHLWCWLKPICFSVFTKSSMFDSILKFWGIWLPWTLGLCCTGSFMYFDHTKFFFQKSTFQGSNNWPYHKVNYRL